MTIRHAGLPGNGSTKNPGPIPEPPAAKTRLKDPAPPVDPLVMGTITGASFMKALVVIAVGAAMIAGCGQREKQQYIDQQRDNAETILNAITVPPDWELLRIEDYPPEPPSAFNPSPVAGIYRPLYENPEPPVAQWLPQIHQALTATGDFTPIMEGPWDSCEQLDQSGKAFTRPYLHIPSGNKLAVTLFNQNVNLDYRYFSQPGDWGTAGGLDGITHPEGDICQAHNRDGTLTQP